MELKNLLVGKLIGQLKLVEHPALFFFPTILCLLPANETQLFVAILRVGGGIKPG